MEPFQRLVIPIYLSSLKFDVNDNSEIFDMTGINDYDKFYNNFIRNLNNTEIIRATGSLAAYNFTESQYVNKKYITIPKKGTALETICQAICDEHNSEIIGIKGLFKKKMQLSDAVPMANEIIEKMHHDPNFRVTYEREERDSAGITFYYKFIYEPETASNRSWITENIPREILYSRLENIKYVETDLNYQFNWGKKEWVEYSSDREKSMNDLIQYIEGKRDYFQKKNIPYLEIGDKSSPYVKKIFSDKDPIIFKNYKELKEFMKLPKRAQNEFIEKRIEDSKQYIQNQEIDLL